MLTRARTQSAAVKRVSLSLVLLSYIIDEEDRGIYSVPLSAPDLVILMRRRGRGVADSMAAAHWSDRYSVLAALFVDQTEPGLHLYLIAVIVPYNRAAAVWRVMTRKC